MFETDLVLVINTSECRNRRRRGGGFEEMPHDKLRSYTDAVLLIISLRSNDSLSTGPELDFHYQDAL